MVQAESLDTKNEGEEVRKTLTFRVLTGIITKLYAQGDLGVTNGAFVTD